MLSISFHRQRQGDKLSPLLCFMGTTNLLGGGGGCTLSPCPAHTLSTQVETTHVLMHDAGWASVFEHHQKHITGCFRRQCLACMDHLLAFPAMVLHVTHPTGEPRMPVQCTTGGISIRQITMKFSLPPLSLSYTSSSNCSPAVTHSSVGQHHPCCDNIS